MKKVMVIVVTFDGIRYVDACFSTLAAARDRAAADGLAVEVVAVDNASTDGTVAALHAFPWVTVIESQENLGFAGGNNLAMRRAQGQGFDYVYLLNHDTEVEPDFLTEAVAAAERDPQVGAAQSLLLLHPEQELVNSAGNAIHFLGFGYCLGYRRPAASIPRDGASEIGYASGAAVLLRVSALREVGLFDPAYFMYHEDTDLGWRLRLAGWKNVLAPRSVVYHKYEFSRSIRKFYWMERNRFLTLLSNLRLWSLVVLALPLLAGEAGVLLSSLRSGWWREKLRAYAYFLRPSAWVQLAAARRRVGRLRRVGDREIVRLFVTAIDYQEVSNPFVERVANPLMAFVWWMLRPLIV